jgi:hypothetical protein
VTRRAAKRSSKACKTRGPRVCAPRAQEAAHDRAQWDLYWRKHGIPEMSQAAARQWWLTPGRKPNDMDAFLEAAPELVRRVIERQGLPLGWRWLEGYAALPR